MPVPVMVSSLPARVAGPSSSVRVTGSAAELVALIESLPAAG